MQKTVGSRSISSQMPWRIASTKVALPPRAGRWSLCSFLTAVAMSEPPAVAGGHLLLIDGEGPPATAGGSDRPSPAIVQVPLVEMPAVRLNYRRPREQPL